MTTKTVLDETQCSRWHGSRCEEDLSDAQRFLTVPPRYGKCVTGIRLLLSERLRLTKDSGAPSKSAVSRAELIAEKLTSLAG